jgi:hypothetical protein
MVDIDGAQHRIGETLGIWIVTRVDPLHRR